MEWFKIVVKRPPFKDIVEFHEVLGDTAKEPIARANYWSCFRNVKSVKIERISQADYIHATRPGE